jgi:hypothetical protein
MLMSLIPVRVHGWLDEFASVSYVGGALLLGFKGPAFWLLLAAGAYHFANTRLTDYPQGQLKVYSLATHAKLELLEGIAVLTAALSLPGQSGEQRLLLGVLGVSQLIAALAGDTRVRANAV